MKPLLMPAILLLATPPGWAAAQTDRSALCLQGALYAACSIPASAFAAAGLYGVRLAFAAAPAGVMVRVRTAVTDCNHRTPAAYDNQTMTPGANLMIGGVTIHPSAPDACVQSWITCSDGSRTERSCSAMGMVAPPTMRVALIAAR